MSSVSLIPASRSDDKTYLLFVHSPFTHSPHLLKQYRLVAFFLRFKICFQSFQLGVGWIGRGFYHPPSSPPRNLLPSPPPPPSYLLPPPPPPLPPPLPSPPPLYRSR